MVCFGAREGVVGEGQAGQGGLHGVTQGPGAAVPGEPGAQLAEVLAAETVCWDIRKDSPCTPCTDNRKLGKINLARPITTTTTTTTVCAEKSIHKIILM